MPEKVIYLSSCAVMADGEPNPFMMQEMPWLLKRFQKVLVVSHYGVSQMVSGDEKRIHAQRRSFAALRAWLCVFFTRDLWRELGHLRGDGRMNLISVLKLIMFTQRGLKMHFWTETLLKEHGGGNTVLYSFWMSFDGYAAALTKRKHPSLRLVLRGHAFDIDTERNPMNPYLMKRMIAGQADAIYLIGESTKAQYLSYMKGLVPEEKVHVLSMGSGGAPLEHIKEPPLHTQGVLRIVSCAQIIKIKQVHLIVEALEKWQGYPLHWVHIGGGEGEKALRSLAGEKLDRKENIIYDIKGRLESSEIHQLYETRAFDAFVNTSQREGMPVSFMEAMRCGIPVIAPRVGGIPEMVTEDVGLLYEPEEGADGLLHALERLAALPSEEASQMHKAAQNRWNERYSSQNLLPQLFPKENSGKA